MRRVAPRSWYLLIHQLPPRPLYLRAKIRQQLVRVGAVPVKKSVYALAGDRGVPRGPRVDRAGGGDGRRRSHRVPRRLRRSAAAAALRGRSRELRDGEYQELLEELARAGTADAGAAVARARARFHEIRRLDFFDAPKGRRRAKNRTTRERRRTAKTGRPGARSRASRLVGKIWVTRSGMKVDRIASAWLVRRFLDAKAKFRFEAARNRTPPGRSPSTWSERTSRTKATAALRDPAAPQRNPGPGRVREIAEIVHDIDLKDAKFGRPEAAGVSQILAGLFAATSDDSGRLTEGSPGLRPALPVVLRALAVREEKRSASA